MQVRVAHLLTAVAIAMGAVWLTGLGLLLAADRTVAVTLPRQEAPPEGVHNLASYRYGPRLQASSYVREVGAQHHPAFLVDERQNANRIEKWASAGHDRQPWVEVRWREPRTLEAVTITHAGQHEEAAYTARVYRLVCLRDAGSGPSVAVVENHDPVARHELPCTGARGVRLEARPNRAGQLVRIYEIEAWGR